MEQATAKMPTGDTLNAHLAAGGSVQVSTYAKSTIYSPKHAGMFKTGKDGNLYVQRGKHWDCLSYGGQFLAVSIRLSNKV